MEQDGGVEALGVWSESETARERLEREKELVSQKAAAAAVLMLWAALLVLGTAWGLSLVL